ncbi:MAG: GntR family transcriptional regulator [Candidatus Velthaea sp.]|jgi:DNA-binding GntR family transcriptional regulator
MRRGRLAEYAYEYTKRMLFDGTLAPGAKLRVEDVVASLHTSRQPVMDAFKRLAAEGFLEITPQVGCRVVVPDAAEIADFFHILGAVQGLACDMGAERRTPDDIARLNTQAAEIDSLLEEPPERLDVLAFRRLDHDFQKQLNVMAHSDTVAHVASGLLDRRDFYLTCIANTERMPTERLREIQGEHRAVAAAIAEGNAEVARARAEALVLSLGRIAVGTRTSAATPVAVGSLTPV